MADSNINGAKEREQGRKWIERIKASYDHEKQFFNDAEKAERVYVGETTRSDSTDTAWSNRYDFNILYSNVETIVPAIINSPPAPDIRRRFNDSDPVAKDVAEILERSIRVQIDDSHLQTEMEKMAQDGFLAGRGLVRIRFKSEISETYDEDDIKAAALSDESEKSGAPDREDNGEDEGRGVSGDDSSYSVTQERICFEAVSWRDYRHGPAKRWEDRPWEAFRHSIPREDIEGFADTALYSAQNEPTDALDQDKASDIIVWERWYKKDRSVWFIEEDTGKILKKIHDPLELSGFYSICTPVQPIELNGRLMPVNPFAVYRKLAEELDIVTRRIYVITDQMRVRGWYPGSSGDLQNMLEAGDTDFVPIADAEIWAQNGGLQNAVQFWPIERFAQALRELYVARDQTKQAIYEITGISDIVRGQAKASETATAQNIKSQWGSLRVQKMQRMMERAARDLFVMMAEIIPSKFSAKTLQDMTGIQLIPTEQDMAPIPPPMPTGNSEQDQQAQQQWQQASQAQQQKIAHLGALNALLGEKLQTYYRIDVESDSTVRADLTRQKQEVAEFLQGASAYFAAVGPLVQQGALPADLAMEVFASTSRMFNLGKSVEDAIDKATQMAKERANQPPPPNPEEIRAQAEQQKMQAELGIEKARSEAEQAKAQAQIQTQTAKMEGDMAKINADLQAKQIDADIKIRTSEQQLEIDRQKHALEMRKIDAEIEKIRVGTISSIAQNQAKADMAERQQSFKESQAKEAVNDRI